ncbi:putative ATP-dependent exodeoxyribonuclease domain protein (plasmid) [Bosea sp. RAC05]|nr:putative ATP-dependent exodeoxyribonuclease domain protein [Bosea sp. RAC05]
MVVYLVAADQSGAQLGHCFGLGCLAGFSVLLGWPLEIESCDAWMRTAIGMPVVESGEAWLIVGGGEGCLEPPVHELQDRAARAEVRRDREHVGRVLSRDGLARGDIGPDIGAAEAVDRLLWVTDEEQGAGPKGSRRPVTRAVDILSAEPPEDFRLEGVGVLKLVDQDVGIAVGQRLTDSLVVAQQVARGLDQVVEVQQRGVALVGTELLDQRLQLGHERSQQSTGRIRDEVSPGFAGRLVERIDLIEEALALGLRERSLRSRRRPRAFAPISPESAGRCAEIFTWRFIDEPNQNRRPLILLGRRDSGRQRLEGGDDAREVGLDAWCRIEERAQRCDRRSEGGRGSGNRTRRRRHQLARAAHAVGHPLDCAERLVGIDRDHLDEERTAIGAEPIPDPSIAQIHEDEVGIVAVGHRGAGVDVGLGRVGLDQPLAEAVDGRAGDLIDLLACAIQIGLLLAVEFAMDDAGKLDGNATGQELVDELTNTGEQLARSELGECDGCDVARPDTRDQHHGDAASHDRGLPRAGACLDEQRAVMGRHRNDAVGLVGEVPCHDGHQRASQTAAAGPSIAVEAACFRGWYPFFAFAGRAKSRSLY